MQSKPAHSNSIVPIISIFIIIMSTVMALTSCGQSTAEIEGVVSNHGRKLANVVIALKNISDESTIAETKTDDQGNFKLSDIQPGTYTLSIITPSNACQTFSMDNGWTIIGLQGKDATTGDTKYFVLASREVILKAGTTGMDFDFGVGGSCILGS